MDRVYKAGASASPPAAPTSPSVGFPTGGNPGTGTPATKPGDYWYYMMTEEQRAVIVAAGITPDHLQTTQLRDAILALIAAGAANDYKASARAATTANITTLAGGAPNTLDGVTLAANDRILVKDQTTASQNGLYYVATLGTGSNGTWTRATDADQAGELTSGAIIAIEEGAVNADSQWMLTTDSTITIGTTSLTFTRKDSVGASAGTLSVRNFKADALGINNYNCVITADEAVLVNSSNAYLTVRAVNKTVNANGVVGAPLSIMSARAASTWYYRWLWYNAANGLTATLDTSSTAPTAPTGYAATDYKALLPGACRTDSSGSTYLWQTRTRGRKTRFSVLAGSNIAATPQMAVGVAGSVGTPTWVAVSTTGFVPPTAQIITAHLICANASTFAIAAQNSSYGAADSTPTNLPPMSAGSSSSSANIVSACIADLVLESSNIYWACSGSFGSLSVLGWED